MNKYRSLLVVILILMSATLGWVAHGLLTGGDITPNEGFFELHIGRVPDISKEAWTLEVGGLVDTPASYNLTQLTELPTSEARATLKCVEGPSATAIWEGVAVSELLDRSGVGEGAVDVVFRAADGYDSSLSLEDVASGEVLLAYVMNGESLPPEQGYPVRVVAPGKAGYKWVMWVVGIEVVDHDHLGYWESRGWDDEADLVAWADWLPHAALLTVAAALGGLAAVSGLKFSREGRFWRDLPDWVTRRLHTRASWAYNLVLLPTFAYWVVATLVRRGSVFYSSHGVLALVAVSLSVVGLVTGQLMEGGREGLRRVHLAANVLGYLLLLGVIAIGLLLI